MSLTARWLLAARTSLRSVALKGRLPGVRDCGEEALGRLLLALQASLSFSR